MTLRPCYRVCNLWPTAQLASFEGRCEAGGRGARHLSFKLDGYASTCVNALRAVASQRLRLPRVSWQTTSHSKPVWSHSRVTFGVQGGTSAQEKHGRLALTCALLRAAANEDFPQPIIPTNTSRMGCRRSLALSTEASMSRRGKGLARPMLSPPSPPQSATRARSETDPKHSSGVSKRMPTASAKALS